MKVIELIRSLSLKDREALGEEIHCSVGHLNGLDGVKRKPTILTVYRIYKSDFNKQLPKAKRLTKVDFLKFVNDEMESHA